MKRTHPRQFKLSRKCGGEVYESEIFHLPPKRSCATVSDLLLRTARNILRLVADVPHQRGGTAERSAECTARAESADLVEVGVDLRKYVQIGLAVLRELPQVEVPPQCAVECPRRLKVGSKPAKPHLYF